MSVESRALQAENRKRHEAACRELRKHLPSFMIVGEQLLIIRDAGVYLETHKSLESFVEDEFGLERRRAYQYIEAATVKANLCTNCSQTLPKLPPILPSNEGQFREVAKAPPEKQAEVVRKAAERAAKENRKPTAKDYKKVVGELVYEDVKPSLPETNGNLDPPKGKPPLSREEQAKANRKLAVDYIAKAVNAVDDYHAIKPNGVSRADVIKLLQKAGDNLW